MTPEVAAQNLADALGEAESALANVTAQCKVFSNTMKGSIGPMRRQSYIRRAQGVEGALLDLHLDLSAVDPRPVVYDGGGK